MDQNETTIEAEARPAVRCTAVLDVLGRIIERRIRRITAGDAVWLASEVTKELRNAESEIADSVNRMGESASNVKLCGGGTQDYEKH